MESLSTVSGEKTPTQSLLLGKKDIDTDCVSDTETTIDSYIEKSPITNKFRIENPNLQPMAVHPESDTNPSTDVAPLSPLDEENAPIFGSNSYYKSSQTRPKTHRRAASHAQTLPLDDSPPVSTPSQDTDCQLSRSSTTTSISSKSFKDNFKRLSLSKSFTRSTGDMKRNINRLSLSRMGTASSPSLHSYKVGEKTTPQNVPDQKPRASTPFWKYHILKFGKNLYLTTNPGLKHIYCRNGPGYYVEVLPSKQGKSLKDGFSLIFRDIHSVEPNKQTPNSSPPIMTITKKSKVEGGHLTLSIPRHSKLQNDMIKYVHSDNIGQAPIFNGLSIPKKIDLKYIPLDQIGSNRRLQEIDRFRSYEFKDFNKMKWDIGSIPRVRVSRMNRFKSKIKNTMDEEDEQNTLKFIGKKNIYFHQNFVEKDPGMFPKYCVKSEDPKKVYLQESESNHDFPPVLALFRPYETKTGKKIMQSLNRKFQAGSPQISELNSYQDHNIQKSNKINHKLLDHDIGAGADIKNYYQSGDGLYFHINPSDDTPDENKLGWITVYEDKKIFSSRGMFDIVVGLTLAVGFESCLE